MEYVGLTQSYYGHEYRFIFPKEEAIKEGCTVGEWDDISFPMGGSNASSTFTEELRDEDSIREFLTREAYGPDLEDPLLIDIAEYRMSIGLDNGCAGEFLEKFGLTARELEQDDDMLRRKDRCQNMMAEMKPYAELVDEIMSTMQFDMCEFERPVDKIDFENPFYGDGSDLRFSELEDIYSNFLKKKEEWDNQIEPEL